MLLLFSHALAATLTVGAGQNFVSLQDAIDNASDGDVIELYELAFYGAYNIGGGDATTPRSLTFRSGNPGGTVLYASNTNGDGNVTYGFFRVRWGTITLDGLVLDGGEAERAARVDSQGVLVMQGGEIRHGDQGARGAGVEVVDDGRLELYGTHVHDNHAGGAGGGVSVVDGASLAAVDATFSGNTASGNGGAVHCEGECVFVDTDFLSNESRARGGALHFDGPVGRVEGGLFESNAVVVNNSGGAVACTDPCEIDQAVFVGNTTVGSGGALYVQNAGVLTGLRLCANTANDGGAVRIHGDSSILRDSILWGNSATDEGGALALSGPPAALEGLTFVGNSAGDHGEAASAYGTAGDVTLSDSILAFHVDPGRGVLSDQGSPNLFSDWVLAFGNDTIPVTPLHYGSGTGTNTLYGDPLFVDDPTLLDPLTDCATIDLRLQKGSPGIDASYGADGYVGGAEACVDEVLGDGIDQDCDGSDQCLVDLDEDTFGAGAPVPGTDGCILPTEATVGGDCDDTDANRSPGLSEVCDADHVDNDCDGLDDVEEGLTVVGHLDGDGDGYGLPFEEDVCELGNGYVAEGGDCIDDRPDVNPAQAEICGDSVDNDCDDTTPDDCGTTTTDTGPTDTGSTGGPGGNGNGNGGNGGNGNGGNGNGNGGPGGNGGNGTTLYGDTGAGARGAAAAAGCGCDAGSSGAAGWLALGLSLALLRRR